MGYPEATAARWITSFVAAARANNVRILAWAGPSIPMSNRSPQFTDNFFRSRLGGIPYVSLMSGGYRHSDRLHFTASAYQQIKRDIDARITQSSR